MARASTPTLLSLDRFAQILGINPLHFNGATAAAASAHYFPMDNRCADLWMQYSWQYADSVSREDLAYALWEAEVDIANELGWWPAPLWTVQEAEMYPRHHRRDVYQAYGRNLRAQRKSVRTDYVKVIAAGRKALDEVELAATVTFSDADSDGFAETATISVTTTVTNRNEIRVFFAGYEGLPEWEIRPPRTKEISGGTVTMTFWSWQFIDPAEWERVPVTTDMTTIDLSGLTETPIDTTNLVTTADVYRVYNDPTEVSCVLVWEPEPNSAIITTGFCSTLETCEGCVLTEQNGCLHVRDPNRGFVVPTPATYDSSDARWEQDCFDECREPDFVKMWYYSGHQDNGYLAGNNLDPLSHRWALAIAQLAVSRLERPFCSCGNVTALCNKWQIDLAFLGDKSYQLSSDDLDNPFGTRRGAIEAWRKVKRERSKIRGGGAI